MFDEELQKSLNETHARAMERLPKMPATGEAHEWLPQGVTARYVVKGDIYVYQPSYDESWEWVDVNRYEDTGSLEDLLKRIGHGRKVRVTVEVLE